MSQILRYIQQISRCGRQYRSDAFEPLGIKACHGRYLQEICQNPGICQEQLTETVLVNKSNVARQVAALEEGGLLERRACGKDKRVLRLYPTEKALALMPQINSILDSWDRQLLQDLTQEEQLQLKTLLGRIRQRAAEAVAEE